MATLDQSMSDRFGRRQERVAQARDVSWQKSVASAGELAKAKEGAGEQIAGGMRQGAEWLYDYVAKGRDDEHLAARSEEINARFRNGVGGVLIRRITKRTADGAGNFLPSYVGLQVVGQGDTELLAQLDYEDRLAKSSGTGRYTPAKMTVCTPQNPTGEPLKAQAMIAATPEGFNMGYASAMAASIAGVMSDNPRNIAPSQNPHSRAQCPVPLRPRQVTAPANKR